MPIREGTYQKVALEDPSGRWELHCGQLRQKPLMSSDHNETLTRLFGWLFQQLDMEHFRVRSNAGSVRHSAASYYIPDVYVVPAESVRSQQGRPRLEVFRVPLLLVIEVWSPSTGDYDVEVKLREYQHRGDLEIWRVHPYEHTITSWVRQPDGSYLERTYASGMVRPTALPDVAIDLDGLFA
jgi:Uma2 family endonuclease